MIRKRIVLNVTCILLKIKFGNTKLGVPKISVLLSKTAKTLPNEDNTHIQRISSHGKVKRKRYIKEISTTCKVLNL